MIDVDYLYFFATTELHMSDEVFWSSGLKFLFGQFDKLIELNEKRNKQQPGSKNRVGRKERVEKQSFKKLSPKEINKLRAKATK